MSTKNTAAAAKSAPFQEDTLPGELPSFGAEETSGDSSIFVQFDEPGQTFDGMFIRYASKGENGLEYHAALFAEYPSGEVRLLPYGWSMDKEMEKQNEKGRVWERSVVRITLERVKVTDEGTKKEKQVKLFQYAYMTLNEAQADKFRASIRYTDTWNG